MEKIKTSQLFSSKTGERIYSQAVRAIENYSMDDMIARGVLVGLSGGADSVMLLCFLVEYRKRSFDFPILAFHVNHCIRGDEAERDEAFARKFAGALGIEFVSERIDIPRLAQASGLGTEECARNERYRAFSELLKKREDIASIAVAHNADDNMETAILNILRGAGSRGAAGIPPVRDNIFRPLIFSSKSDITDALANAGISFVTDSTNLSDDYKRNFVRNRISPMLARIAEAPEEAFSRLSANLRSDDEYISSVADAFLRENSEVSAQRLQALHFSVFVRVLSKMAGQSVSSRIASKIYSLLKTKNFSYSIGGGLDFVCRMGLCRVGRAEGESVDFLYEVAQGLNHFPDRDSVLIISGTQTDKSSLKVYKISIQVSLCSAIINGRLFIRPRRDGDSIYYGGMTHKLKKLYNDAKIPLELRAKIPVLCDEKGVLWVPGFGVRDDGVPPETRVPLYAALAIGTEENNTDNRFYSASEFR